jgi:energy-coupling factor transporter ATP-binding protein EcfA2
MSPDGTSWGCRRLEVRYGATVALGEVSFEVAAGTVAAVVGGDGAGKTSLLRALAGTVRPAAGTVRRPDERRLGYVSAGPGVWTDLTVAPTAWPPASSTGGSAGCWSAPAWPGPATGWRVSSREVCARSWPWSWLSPTSRTS